MYHYLKIFLFIFTIIFSFATHYCVDSYIPTGGQLLKNNTFSYGSKGWETKYKEDESKIQILPNHIILSAGKTPTSIKVSQTLQSDTLPRHFLLTADVKTNDIITGTHPWNRGRVLLVQYQSLKPQWGTQHSLIALDGSNDWKTYKHVFTINPKTTKIEIVAQISEATGTLHCKNIELHAATPNPKFLKLKIVIYCLWGSFFLFALFPYLKTATTIPKLVITTLTVTLLFGITMSANLKNVLRYDIRKSAKSVVSTIENYASDQALSVEQSPSETQKYAQKRQTFKSFIRDIDITKIAHFLLFMGLGLVLLWSRPLFIQQILFNLFLMACGTETLQLFIEGRSALWSDVGIDFFGGFVGVMIGYIILTIKVSVK